MIETLATATQEGTRTMDSKHFSSLVTSIVVGTVLAPACIAQLATCMKNQLGRSACGRGMPAQTVLQCSSGACTTPIVVTDSECYNIVAATGLDVGRNNTVAPTPQKQCVYQNRGCIIDEQTGLSTCGNNGAQTTINVYCPEIAGETCNGGVAPGGGGGND